MTTPPTPRIVQRLGKLDTSKDGCRPLRVIFYSESDKWVVVRRYAEIKSSDEAALEGVVIAPDKTKRQMEERKKLKIELEELKKAGITDRVIKGNKLVKMSEQELYKRLRAEIERRKEAGEGDWIIREMELVRVGQPFP